MAHKLFKLWICFIFIFTQNVYSQEHEEKIKLADSLFAKNNFEKSLQVYEIVFDSTGKYSLSMLLKMAFLNERNGDYSKALFYLNIFYRDQPDKRILEQMEVLAEKNNLVGYKYTDLEYFTSLYNEYYYHIIIYILLGSFAYFLNLVVKKYQKKNLGYRSVAFIIILMIVFYITNYRIIPTRAIISNKNALLMTAPSAGSNVIDIVGEGHRVTLYRKKDIWYEISWEEGRAFIREDDLHIIPQNNKLLF